jgi:hypothetical protein
MLPSFPDIAERLGEFFAEADRFARWIGKALLGAIERWAVKGGWPLFAPGYSLLPG